MYGGMDEIMLMAMRFTCYFIPHHSGETEDPFIAALALVTAAGKIKTGSGC